MARMNKVFDIVNSTASWLFSSLEEQLSSVLTSPSPAPIHLETALLDTATVHLKSLMSKLDQIKQSLKTVENLYTFDDDGGGAEIGGMKGHKGEKAQRRKWKQKMVDTVRELKEREEAAAATKTEGSGKREGLVE